MRPRDRYDSLLQFYAERAGLDWLLLKAQMLAESAANPDAVSPAKAIGLAQFMRATWAEWWDGTPGIQGRPRWSRRNPEAAIRAMAAYVGWLLVFVAGRLEDPRDTWRAVWAAYNWGPGNLARHLREHGGVVSWGALPGETRGYVARIERISKELSA